jgi:mono/diheme cytochrome c family protein
MARLLLPRAALRLSALAALVASVPGCGGCTKEPEFPPNFSFPARADRLVLKLPNTPATKPGTAGQRDEEIDALDALGGTTRAPATLPPEARAEVTRFLEAAFGTPAEPKDVSASLKLTGAHLQEGGRLYKRHCLDCHNLTGDGRGAKSGQFLVPHPRDYRQGAFKFVTTGEGTKPRRADLLRTLENGLKGTGMPSFSLLPAGERDLLAGYVSFLALRGEVEFEALKALATGAKPDLAALQKAAVTAWENAESAPALPAPPPDGEPESKEFQEAVRRGHKLFTAKVENSCVTCHEDYGRKPVLRYDVWGTVTKPATLTDGVFKGGARPEDLYARIRFGIPSVGMPAHAPPKYGDRDVWDLVRFVQSASKPKDLPPDVRAVVYP